VIGERCIARSHADGSPFFRKCDGVGCAFSSAVGVNDGEGVDISRRISTPVRCSDSYTAHSKSISCGVRRHPAKRKRTRRYGQLHQGCADSFAFHRTIGKTHRCKLTYIQLSVLDNYLWGNDMGETSGGVLPKPGEPAYMSHALETAIDSSPIAAP